MGMRYEHEQHPPNLDLSKKSSPSLSTTLIICSTSSLLVTWPKLVMATVSSSCEIQPSLFLSNSEKASLKAENDRHNDHYKSAPKTKFAQLLTFGIGGMLEGIPQKLQTCTWTKSTSDLLRWSIWKSPEQFNQLRTNFSMHFFYAMITQSCINFFNATQTCIQMIGLLIKTQEL